ncbi:MAG: glycosyltransferase, partial [Bacteroidales bacterium]|nr:glycosyltransferase [Bacteroidales bacterium]
MAIPSVSIIVPVYNVELYLSKCIDSILAQSFTDWECILVDDGSKDSSGKICDEYALKDTRIKVIHQTNKGVSVARQVGIDNASGEYSIHIDPDDWVEPNML